MFQTIPGMIKADFHYILITGTPVHVSPRQIPAHYKEEVEQQIQDILDKGMLGRVVALGWPRNVCKEEIR